MQLPRAMFRSLLVLAVIVVALVLRAPALAADEISSHSSSSKLQTERLLVTRGNLRFGNVAVGRQRIQTVTLSNLGHSDITLLQVITRGQGFSVSGLDLPLTLASGENFTFNCVFAPQTRGDSSGAISFISDNSTQVLESEMTGTGIDGNALTVEPATMNFGAVQVGSSHVQRGTLTAADKAVTIFSAGSNSPDFVLKGLSFPLTIPAWGSQQFSVTFTPRSGVGASAALFFTDVPGTTNPLAVESLNGMGASSQGDSVDLSWNASTSQNVIGYNIYRGLKSGGPYSKINPVLNASTAYTDTSVASGNTYYYVTTAVNSSEEESGYSNQAQATIP
jgi:hypothetical protein